ncbi:hypothetical protein H4W34_006828 [Actinomadura algeriensis]|uniref:Uncharacterized protein n=1 Tax=Actinomadura algeriensis TaxID=1679523 RepID=A0ABR9K2A4_9ACTN|nr:hypothetical protein [Actinomadura algeriensis]
MLRWWARVAAVGRTELQGAARALPDAQLAKLPT